MVWSELETLLWLQYKLTISMLRTRDTSDRLRVLVLLSRVLVLVFSLPMCLLMGIGLAVGLILLPAAAAYEAAMMVNTFLFFFWLVLPASYNSQIIERFEMSRLFVHPIRFKTIVVGSTLMSTLTMTGIWTVPLLIGEVVGLAWHQPWALPMIVVGAVPAFALLAQTGRIMDDLFDLVSGDRRLRAIVLALLSVPFMFCWLGQYLAQHVTDNYEQLPDFVQGPVTEELAQLDEPETFQDFVRVSGRALEVMELSRYLIWLPPGWATSGMALAARGEWGRGALFLGLSCAFVALLLLVHARIARRLMEGAALGVGAERIRQRRLGWRLPGPASFWALFGKDWAYLWRSPIPRRLIFSSVIAVLALLMPLRDARDSNLSPMIRRALPLLSFGLVSTLTGMGINMTMAANYFGTFDREGFGTLAVAPVDRRYVLLSANLATAIYVLAQDGFLALAIAALTGSWVVLPLALYIGLCVQIGHLPPCNLASILAPYRTQLKFSTGRRHGNIWGMLAWLVSAPPVWLMVGVPYLFWRPGLGLALPLAAVYAGALYGCTLRPLARLLQRREDRILDAVAAQE